VTWAEAGPVLSVDPLYPEDGPCPFETLRHFCTLATADGRFATLVCDDSGGLEQGCTEDDYDTSLVRLRHVARGHLLFTGAMGEIPYRAIYVVND
jgi:hypothetical protein